MTEITWEKSVVTEKKKNKSASARWKFGVGGLVLLGAVLYLLLSGTMVGARYFITVEEVIKSPTYIGQTVRMTGAVIGDTIVYAPESGQLNFTIVNIPQQVDDLASAIHRVVNDPTSQRLAVQLDDYVMPDTLQHEAQAILTGRLGEDGVFYATELLLKCPSRFQESTPGNLIDLTSDASTE